MAMLSMTGDHGDNPWKFRNHVIVLGIGIVLRHVKPIENEKKRDGFYTSVCVVFKLNSI